MFKRFTALQVSRTALQVSRLFQFWQLLALLLSQGDGLLFLQ